MGKLGIVSEYVRFLARSGRWWLVPIVLALLLLGALVVLTQGSALAPFLYSLF